MGRTTDRKIPFCDVCGCEITDMSRCSMYRAGGPHYETVYICEDCHDSGKGSDAVMESYGLAHVDMDNGEAL